MDSADSENPPRKIPHLAPLAGSAQPGRWLFSNSLGEKLEKPRSPIFAILRQPIGDTTPQLVGTGFFVATNGIFVTAKHVLTEMFDANHLQVAAPVIFQLLPDNIFVSRPILRYWSHNVWDIAVGVAAPMTNNKTGKPLTNDILRLTTRIPQTGSPIATYAYPNVSVEKSTTKTTIHLSPDLYDGKLIEVYPNGRDRSMLPGPSFHMDVHVHGGASGGPVFDGISGLVFGVNCTSFTSPDISFGLLMKAILGARIDDVQMPGEPTARSVMLLELIEQRHVDMTF